MASGNSKDAHLDWPKLQQYFQRLVNEVLSGLNFAFGYLDDISVISPDMVTHIQHLRCLFDKLRAGDLKLQEIKCNFLKKNIYNTSDILYQEKV